MIGTITTRPPRPTIPPADLLAKYKAHGMPATDVREAWTTPEGDVHINTDGGIRFRIVDPSNPDGGGLSGLLLEFHPKGYGVGRCRPFTPRTAGVSGDAWTLQDLTWMADKLFAPQVGTMVQDGWAGHRGWLHAGDNDVPIRCFSLWRSQALGRMRTTMTKAAQQSQLCAALRREILASGWLSDSAAAELATL